MNEKIKVDRRVEKTRKAILDAFKEMIIEMEYKDITVKALAERANINRKTFYLHYESLDEILYDLTLELSDIIFDELNDKGFFATDSFQLDILVEATEELISNNYNLVKKLVSANSYRFFSRNIKDLVKDSFIRKIRNKVQLSGYLMNLAGDYVASGVAKLLKDWFENPGTYSLKDISEMTAIMIFSSVEAFISYANKSEHQTIFG